MIGSRLNHYTILEPLGKGGMGEVYLANDSKLHRKVALKVLPTQMASDPERLSRFQREARAVAALNHPSIVTIHSVEEDNGVHFITMEMVQGIPLSERLDERGMDAGELLEIAVPLARALSVAHGAGITHRDLKPQNVMVLDDGRIKVLDFGLAKFAAPTAEAGDDSELPTEPRTRKGMIVGTVPYMSPEQAEGRRTDERSDIFSLGVMLYEMAAGRRPFRGETAIGTLSSILKDEPVPVKDLKPEFPDSVCTIIGRCLAKEPNERYQNGEELFHELTRIVEGVLAKPRATPESLEIDGTETASSIAVLPFANMSSEPDNEYFGDGLAEEILNALTKLEGLRVVARTSAFSFKGQNVDVREIGEKLGVGAVLEGSVRKAGNDLRVTAQLINVSDGYHLWSERYDRELDDVFAIQDEITVAIVDELKVELLGAEKEDLLAHKTKNRDAYVLYLQGRYHFHKVTTSELQRAAQCFRKAIETDPMYVKAHAGLAGSIMFLGGAGPSYALVPEEAYPQARAAIEKALEVDELDPDAQTMLGVMRTVYELNWDGAAHAFRNALRTNPNNADISIWYGWHSWVRGRFGDALEQVEKALELDPLSPLPQQLRALVLYCNREYHDAIERFQQVLDLHPNWMLAEMHLADAYYAVGELERAESGFLKARELDAHHSHYAHARLCGVHAALGKKDEASKSLDELLAIRGKRYIPPAYLAIGFLGIGDLDEVFRLLDEESTVQLAIWAIMPWSDPVRSDPRFQRVLERLGDR